MKPGFSLGLLLAPALLAQNQPTFYAAYQDGLDAEHREAWSAAAMAYRRAIELRPGSANRVVIYGNNLLVHYFPYTRLARCEIELGHQDSATRLLAQAALQKEPDGEREALLRRLNPPPTQATPPGSAPAPPSASPTSPQAPPQESPVPLRPDEVPSTTPAPVAQKSLPPSPTPSNPSNPAPRTPLDSTIPPPPAAVSAVPPSAPPTETLPAPRPRWAGFLLAGVGVLIAGGSWLLFRRRRPALETGFREPGHLGPYRIERLLGRGGFASTYLARHEASGASVALKVLHPYRVDDPEFLERFRREARLGAMLDHPNLVRLIDPGPEDGTPWLAMEYIAGPRLDQVLKKEGALPLPRLLTIAREIAGGLAHAHGFGIVHRDLKPGNVILLGDQVKVMDFGISRIMDAQTLTTTYAFLGTPLYAAPEAQLKTRVGPSADLYAFGIMLFEMLAGHTPFHGETPFEILDQHRTLPLPDLASLCPDAPPALIDLIERLCRKDPQQRPNDEEVMTVLTAL